MEVASSLRFQPGRSSSPSARITFGDLMKPPSRRGQRRRRHRIPIQSKPVKISISDEQRILLRRLAIQLAEITLPDSPRELTESEKQEFIQIFTDVKLGKDAITSAETALRETFANHMDVEAIAEHGAVETDRHGHVLRCPVRSSPTVSRPRSPASCAAARPRPLFIALQPAGAGGVRRDRPQDLPGHEPRPSRPPAGSTRPRSCRPPCWPSGRSCCRPLPPRLRHFERSKQAVRTTCERTSKL